jgi:hypothetical protein
MIGVRKNREFHFWKVFFEPGLVRMLTVGRRTDHLAVGFEELFFKLGETTDLRGANESEVEWVEEQANPLSFVILERNVFELPCNIRGGLELRSGLPHFNIPHGKTSFLKLNHF